MPDQKIDLITDQDLPGLRLALIGHASNDAFTESFRTLCGVTVDAIDEAVAADAAINARLTLALETWKLAADAEVAAC